MKITSVAALLMKQLLDGERIPFSRLSHPVFRQLLDEKILSVQLQGRSKRVCYLTHGTLLTNYLYNQFGIDDLEEYARQLSSSEKELSRTENIKLSTHSKLTTTRTFQGFMVNTYRPIEVFINHVKQTLHPAMGSFVFIYDYPSFRIPANITVVGIENPANFRYIENQQELFRGITPLFVSRYPQNQHKDLLSWLQSIPNPYLHFGDFDFAGIRIYQQEFKRTLQQRASFFIPENLPEVLRRYGNRELYNNQLSLATQLSEEEPEVKELIRLLHQEHKGLEQEIFIE